MLSKQPLKKEPPRKKTSNLRIFDILHEQAHERSMRKTGSSKAESRRHIKGKKVDNKTMLHQFRNHLGTYKANVDDFPVVVRHPKESDPFVNNTTLSITKSNNDIESQGCRPGSSVPFQLRRDQYRESRRKQSFSINTNEHNDIERPLRSKSRSTRKAYEWRLGESDKQNRYSQERHSLIDRSRRHSRNRINFHNRSCNDEELLRRSSKSKTPVSRSKLIDKRQKNNTSCMDYIESKQQTSGDKEKKRKRRSSAVLLTKQTVGVISKQSKKQLKKIKIKKENPKKKKSPEKDKSKSKSKERHNELGRNKPSLDPSGFRKKKSVNIESDEDDYDYPISKYINTKKKKITGASAANNKKSLQFTNDLCKRIFTDSSLIRSSIETSKKSSYQYDRNSYDYVQRITELEQEGTSMKKKPRPDIEPEGIEIGDQYSYSFEFDIRQVRQFEKRKAAEMLNKERMRRPLYQSIEEEYPELSQEQVQFLASVIFIQRTWREMREKRRYRGAAVTQNISQQLERDSSQENLTDLIKSNQLGQRSNPNIEKRTQMKDSKSNPDNKAKCSSKSNSSQPEDPLYKLLIQHRRDDLERQDLIQQQLQEIRNTSRVSTDNPLEKYRNYFERLEFADIPAGIQPIEDNKQSANIINTKPVFKRIKRANNYIKKQEKSLQINTFPQAIMEVASELKQEQPEIEHPPKRNNHGLALTERSEYSSVNCEREIFPPLEMISERKKLLLFDYSTKITALEQQYVQQELDTARYKEARAEFEATFQQQISQVKSNTKEVEKGYLKYIDFIKKIKLEANSKHSTLKLTMKSSANALRPLSKLRRVSSEDSIMGRLYSRFCNIESFSNDSNSLKELKQRLLVRKEYVRKDQERDLAILTLRRNLSRQELLLNNEKYLANENRSPRNLLLDMSEKIKIDEGESFDRYDDSSDGFKIQQLDDGHYIREIRDTINDIHESSSVSFDRGEENFVPEFTLSEERPLLPTKPGVVNMGNLTGTYGSIINLSDFLSRIREDSAVDEPAESPSYHIDDSLKKEENSIYLTDQLFQFLTAQLYSQISCNKSLHKKFKLRMERRKRRLPVINCELDGVCEYLDSLFNLIRDSKYRQEVLANFNTALGYAPFNFLKMLRDVEFIPPEEYVQIIPDAAYIDLEEIQLSKLQMANIEPKFENFLKGISSVHNRAIFETVKLQLLPLKPYGEEGLPYPWDPEPVFPKAQVSFNTLQRQFNVVRERIMKSCECKCGLLLQKYDVTTAYELEKVHEDIEQRLLEVIEQEVREDTNWNYINMQLLQTKMDIDTELFSFLLDELIDQVQWVNSKRLRKK